MARIYVSTRTSFMAAVKRTQKALDEAARRGGVSGKRQRDSLTARVAALRDGGGRDGADDAEGGHGEVVVLATGRAIGKAVNLAAWFQRQGGFVVGLRTRSVGAVDDVVRGGKPGDRDNGGDGLGDAGGLGDGVDAEGDGDDEDQARVRMVSCLEVGVRLL